MARVKLGESRIRARRRRRRALVVLGFVLGACMVFGALVWAAHASALRVHGIEVTGAGTIGTATIQNFVEQDVSGDYLGVFPKDNIFLYPKGAIVTDLLHQFPTLKTASVTAANFHTLAVVVSERTATALWCGERVASTSDCFLLDQNGLAYVPAASFSGDAYYKYFGTLSTTTARQFLTPPEFEGLQALVQALAQKESNEQIDSVYIDANSDVHVAFTNGFELIFALHDVGGDLFERFVLALGADPFASHPLSDFEYLDLRFGDKLYYKLKSQ